MIGLEPADEFACSPQRSDDLGMGSPEMPAHVSISVLVSARSASEPRSSSFTAVPDRRRLVNAVHRSLAGGCEIAGRLARPSGRVTTSSGEQNGKSSRTAIRRRFVPALIEVLRGRHGNRPAAIHSRLRFLNKFIILQRYHLDAARLSGQVLTRRGGIRTFCLFSDSACGESPAVARLDVAVNKT